MLSTQWNDQFSFGFYYNCSFNFKIILPIYFIFGLDIFFITKKLSKHDFAVIRGWRPNVNEYTDTSICINTLKYFLQVILIYFLSVLTHNQYTLADFPNTKKTLDHNNVRN